MRFGKIFGKTSGKTSGRIFGGMFAGTFGRTNRFLAQMLLFLLVFAGFPLLEPIDVHAVEFIPTPCAPDSDTMIRLDWSSVPGARIYQLLRDDGQGFAEIAKIDVNNELDPLTYKDSGLQPETTYRYMIRAYSDPSLTVLLDEKTAVASTTEMIRPYNLQAVYDINSKTVALEWDCSKLAAGSIIRMIENSIETVFSTNETETFQISISGQNAVQFSVQSTAPGIPESESSAPVTVVPVRQPLIWAEPAGGTIKISWQAFQQIGLFQLERSKWNGSSWDGWVIVNAALSGTNVIDVPPAGGQYRYRLGAKPGSGYVGFSSITEPSIGLPPPHDLKLSIAGIREISLNWQNGAGNIANVQVLRKMDDGSFTQIALLSATDTSYTDTLDIAQGRTYTYRVRAYASAENYSEAAEASITPSIPAKPGTLFANIVSSSAIRLDWTDLSDNEQGFKIERMTDTGIFTEIGTIAADTATYTDDSVMAGHTYIYRVRSYNAMGNSAYSNEVTINSWDMAPPASLDATPVSSTRIDLAWSYSGTGNYNTIIERKKGTDGAWKAIYTTAAGAVRYSDTGLLPNTRYFYRIRKSLGTGSSGIPYPNNEIGVGAYTFLGDLRLTGEAVSGNRICLYWSGNNAGADVIIERKMPGGNFSALTTVGPSTASWYDNTGLVPGASYTYRIKARTSTNESLYSNELTVRNLYLEEPTGLGASIGADSSVVLKWTDNSADETGFEIWRYVEGTGTGTYALYATVGKNVTAFTDNTVHTGLQYSYKVRAYVAAGSLYSPFSNTASVGVGLINPPANLYYTYISSTQILLRWTDTSDNESGFKVEWKIGPDGDWSVHSWLSPNTSACNISSLNPYTRYYFRVRAYTTSGNADSVSEEIQVSTALPAAPSDIAASSLSPTQVKITWKDNSDSEDGFRIMRKPSNGYYFTLLATVKKDAEVYYDSNVQPGMRYEYKIEAYNAAGSSESGIAEVRTNTKAYFSDLKSVPWAKDAIENLAGLGIINGVSGTLYNPGVTISKAEFTKIVVRTFGFDTAPVGRLEDVKSNEWYYKDVMIAENFGIISGDDKNRFYPESPITREEIAVMLFKALEASGKEFNVHDNSVLEKYADKNYISPHAVSSMATLVGEGIIEGISGNSIGPRQTATRAQAALFVYRLLNMLNK